MKFPKTPVAAIVLATLGACSTPNFAAQMDKRVAALATQAGEPRVEPETADEAGFSPAIQEALNECAIFPFANRVTEEELEKKCFEVFSGLSPEDQKQFKINNDPAFQIFYSTAAQMIIGMLDETADQMASFEESFDWATKFYEAAELAKEQRRSI